MSNFVSVNVQNNLRDKYFIALTYIVNFVMYLNGISSFIHISITEHKNLKIEAHFSQLLVSLLYLHFTFCGFVFTFKKSNNFFIASHLDRIKSLFIREKLFGFLISALLLFYLIYTSQIKFAVPYWFNKIFSVFFPISIMLFITYFLSFLEFKKHMDKVLVWNLFK